MTTQRSLTAGELKALGLVRLFEEATDKHKLIIQIKGNKDVAEAVFKLEKKLKVCKCLRIDYIQDAEEYKIAFSLTEFQKYMFFILRTVGLSLRMDGTLITEDNLVISNEYLNDKGGPR